MPIFHKRPITSYPVAAANTRQHLNPPQKVLLQLASFFSLLIFTRLQSYNVLSQQLFRDTLIAPDFNAPEVLMLISLTVFQSQNCQIPDFLPFKTPFETTLPCGSLKVAGPLYIHYPYKSILPVQFRYQKTFIDTFFYIVNWFLQQFYRWGNKQTAPSNFPFL
jgi:hypothetical protein